ncbi:MAG TPA: hypothetical protein ENN63_01040 [Bacteroidetes bacterium]|nr:hypothetical protein [Bacteroidota bacterium]
MNRKAWIIFLFIMAPFGKWPLYSQDSSRVAGRDGTKLQPIVQVFASASYQVENRHYGFSFSRAHLGFQYRFNEKWNAKIIIDRGRPTTVGEITVTNPLGQSLNVQNTSIEGAYYTMFLKFASLEWKVTDRLVLEGGAILQNHYITQERFWGFRYLAQTFQDLYWKIPSSDLGFIAYYNLNKVLSFDAAVTNGEGPRAKQDASGKVKYAGGLDIHPSRNIQFRMYYHNRQTGIDSLDTEHMFSFHAGFSPLEKLRMGGEFNYMVHLNNAVGLDSYGFSLYSACEVAEKTEIFFRYDRLLYHLSELMESSAGYENGHTLIGGVSFSPFSNIFLSLNYQGWITGSDNGNSSNHLMLSMEYKF